MLVDKGLDHGGDYREVHAHKHIARGLAGDLPEDAHDHPGHAHDHGHHHHDINLRSAYLHVIADAATSVLAIAALIGGKYFGAVWLDPLMGILGAVLVTRWAVGLMRQSGRVLLDAEMDAPVVAEIREVVEQALPAAAISDLHVWRVGKGKYACIVSLASEAGLDLDTVRRALGVHEELVHVSIELSGSPQRSRTSAE